jgi:hypothetical protein
MNSRERFLRTLEYNHPDRVPFLAEGIRDKVLEFWDISRKELRMLSPYDSHTFLTPDLDPIPEPAHWPLNKKQFDKFAHHLNAHVADRFGSEWQEQLSETESDLSIRILRAHRGFFLTMGVNGWGRFDEVIRILMEDKEFVQHYLKEYGIFAARVAEIALSKIKIEAAYFSEPIGGNDAPLISPQIYRQVILDSYLPVLNVLFKHGVKHIIFMSYSNIRNYLPMLVDAGFNCLWACETNSPDMNYHKIRKEFGPDLRLIGGLDVDLLQESRTHIRTVVKKNVLPLLQQGGYIPLADGRVRRNVTWEKYRFYRKILFKTLMKAG